MYGATEKKKKKTGFVQVVVIIDVVVVLTAVTPHHDQAKQVRGATRQAFNIFRRRQNRKKNTHTHTQENIKHR